MVVVIVPKEPVLRRKPVVKFLRKWRQYVTGDEAGKDGKFDPAIAHTLVRNGIAKYIGGVEVMKKRAVRRKKPNANAHRKVTKKKGGDPKRIATKKKTSTLRKKKPTRKVSSTVGR